MKLLNKVVIIIISLNFWTNYFGQISYYSDCFNGGIVGDGYTAWFPGGAGTVNLPIPPGSTIKKAFFFSNLYKWEGNLIDATDKTIEINSIPLTLSESFSVGNMFYMSSINSYISTIAVEITNIIDPMISSYTINTFINESPVIKPLFSDFYILVLFENASSDISCLDVNISNLDTNPTINYNLTIHNALNSLTDVGLSIHASSICDNPDDWYEVFINSTSIGLIGGEEDNTTVYCAGMMGSFIYENSTLIGIGNDVANTTMNGQDGIANIQPYLNGEENFNLTFDYVSNLSPYSNVINQLFLTYTTTCDTFSVSTPNDTTLCQGETLQLNVSGGQSYEWLPATGLSCADCPNPVFTADSSMFYTVRIWNNDTCSVLRPLKINVRPRPEFGTLTTTPSECGTNTGTVTLNAFPNNSIVANWQEEGVATQTSNVFQNLSTGNHTFFFVDTNGCQSADTTVFVGEINTTIASFSVSPQSGAVPLTVQFTNTSQNATNYEWFVEGVSMGSSFPDYEFSTSGTFEIMLVAWQNDPSCADTAIQTVVVYDSLMISVPNVFTPNGDGVNDFFEITNSLPVHCELVIVNRWGTIMYEFSDNLGAGSTKLWDGFSLLFHGDMVEGTYFYDVTFSGANEQTQELEKLGILPIKKSGFVEVRR